MFSKDEIRSHLLGCLEAALFMPEAQQRFRNDYDAALRSFIIPILLFPATLAAVYAYPAPEIADMSPHMIAMLYSLRLAATWALFLAAVYVIIRNIGRRDLFYRFIITMNWISIPATIVFLPVGMMLLAGTHTITELMPAMVCIMLYSYAFTAFAVAQALRVPWQLAGFITLVGIFFSDNTHGLITWAGQLSAG